MTGRFRLTNGLASRLGRATRSQKVSTPAKTKKPTGGEAFDRMEPFAQRIDQLQRDLRELKATYRKQNGETIVALGREASAARDALDDLPETYTEESRGAIWGNWIKKRLDVSVRHAQRWVRAYEQFNRCDNLSRFAPAALYLLCEKGTPFEVVERAKARAECGRVVTRKWVLSQLRSEGGPQGRNEETLLDQLKLLWAQATPDDRDAFDAWREKCDRDAGTIAGRPVAPMYLVGLGKSARCREERAKTRRAS